MRRQLFLFVFLLVHQFCFAQQVIQGLVLEAGSRKPIAGANVYINNSSLGTSTDRSGKFRLAVGESSAYELAISAMSYQAQAVQVSVPQSGNLEILLQSKATEIEEVLVTGFVKDGWKQWGQYFTETLIGIGYNAEKTKILNPEVVRFRFDKKENSLRAYASEPLRIQNNALGYELHYDLQVYRSDFNAKYLYYDGYAFFKDQGKGRAKYKQARRDTYELSLSKFLQSTYLNTWAKEGYIVRKLVRKDNEVRIAARQKLKELEALVQKRYGGNWKLFHLQSDSPSPEEVSAYWSQAAQPEQISYLMGQLQPADIIIEAENGPKLKKINFSDYLYVIYPHRLAESKNDMLKNAASQVTEYFMSNEEGIMVDPTGGYFPTSNMLLMGFGINYSKLAFLLPLDYVPAAK